MNLDLDAYESPSDPAAGNQPLVFVLAVVCAGIVLDRFHPLAFPAWWSTAAFCWVAWLLFWRKGQNYMAATALVVCLAATGGAWHHARWSLFGADDLGALAREESGPACVEAIALSAPRRVPAPPFDPLRAIPAGDRSRLLVRVYGVRDAARWLDASGQATVMIEGHLLGIRAGDRLRIFAQLSAPRVPLNPGEFDFALHNRADRKLSVLSAESPACISRLTDTPTWWPSRILDSLRAAGDSILSQRLARDRSGLALALLLGERDELDPSSTAAYFETGTVHLLSISGLHVGILAAFLFFGLRRGLMPRGPALLAVAAIVTTYALVIDAEPAAVRATVLVLLACAALYLGRPESRFNLLAAAALVVLVMNPTDLFRVGPQLSFMAMATLVWIGPRVRSRREVDPLARLIAATRPWSVRIVRKTGRNLWQATAISMAIWLVTSPLVLARFQLVSPAALLLTPILSLPVALGLLSGFAVLLVGWLAPPLAFLPAWVCDGCLWCIEACVDWARDVPGSHFWLPGPSTWWLVPLYIALMLWAVVPRARPPRRWCVALLATWIAIGLVASLASHQRNGRLDCTFVAVGHGTCVLLELPDGQTMLYDAGQLGSPSAGARSIASVLWSRGITHLDAVVVSHADLDHYNALPELLRRFSVGVVYVSPIMFNGNSMATQTLRSAIEDSGVPLREIQSGDSLRVGGGCRIDVLHPPRRGVLGSDNANSIVLAVEFDGHRLLLPGDLESPGLDDLLAEAPLDCSAVMVPHHGSAQSNPPGFAAWSTPEWVVISGGHEQNLPGVIDTYLRQGAVVLHTAEVGAVQVSIVAGDVQVTSHRTPPLRRGEISTSR